MTIENKLSYLINASLYPSDTAVRRMAGIVVATATVETISMALGVSPGLALPILGLSSPVLLLTEVGMQQKNTVKINDVLKVRTVENKKENSGLIGELHLEGINTNKQWRDFSPTDRWLAIRRETLNGLVELGKKCKENKKFLKGVKTFYGESDLVGRSHQSLLECVGAVVTELDQQKIMPKIGSLKLKRIEASVNYKKVGSVRAIRIERDNLVNGLDNLRSLTQRLTK